jgi:hypothetical protein
VFAAQSECHFAGNTSEDFVRRVNHEPITLDFMALSGKSFHVDFLTSLIRSNGGSAATETGFTPDPALQTADSSLLSFPEQTEKP